MVMRAERVGSELYWRRCANGQRGAAQPRADPELADVVAGYFVPIVVGIAALTFVIWAVWGPNPRLRMPIVNAVAVLINCLPVRAGTGHAYAIHGGDREGATLGVLFKNARPSS